MSRRDWIVVAGCLSAVYTLLYLLPGLLLA